MMIQLKDKLAFNINTINLMIVLSLIPLFEAGYDNEIIYYMIILTSLSYLYSSFKDRTNYKIEIDQPIIWLIMYTIWAGLSYIWSVHYVRTLIEFLQLYLCLIVFIFSTRLDRENQCKVNKIVIIVGNGIALLGILEYIIIKSSRIVSTFLNPNPFGTYLMMLFLFTWGMELRKNKLILKMASSIFLVALFLTGSRGAFISTFLALPFIFIGLRNKKLYIAIIKTILFIIMGLVVTSLIMYLAPIVQENFGINLNLKNSLMRSDSFIASSLVGRLEFWKVALNVFKSKFINGYGLGTFLTTYFIGYGQNQWYSRFVHNHYLQIAAELGIIGLLLFLLFILFSVIKIKSNIKSDDYNISYTGALAGCIGFLIHIGADFSFNFPGVTIIFFYLLGLLLNNVETAKNKKDKKNKLTINYKITNILIVFILIVNLWHFGSVKMYSYGISLTNKGRIEDSNKVFKITNSVYPMNSVGFSLESDNYYKYYMNTNDIKYLDKAISLLEKSVQVSPLDGEFHNKLGKLYNEKGNIQMAEEELILGIKYGVYPINCYIDLGKFYMEKERFEEAIEIFNEGLVLKDYILDGASEIRSERITFDSCYILTLKYEIYKFESNSSMMKAQIEGVNDLTVDYPILRKYFLKIINNK